MAKYEKYSSRSRMTEKPWKIHPIWRGIGCFLMFLIPILAYIGAVLLIDANLANGWLPIPYALAQPVILPFIGKVGYFYARLIVTVLLAIVGFGMITILYSIIYNLLGPPRYGPLDAPPERRRPKKRRY